jgi:hypothetical protein
MAVERSIKRNGRGQIISYPVSFDENGTPLQQYGKLGIGAGDSTDTEKYTKYSFFNEFIDTISDELRQKPTIVNINPAPIYTRGYYNIQYKYRYNFRWYRCTNRISTIWTSWRSKWTTPTISRCDL